MRLEGKAAIITGGANGIGLAAGRRFAEEGARVILADYDEQAGREAEEQLKADGLDVRFICVNVADRESVDRMVEETLSGSGRIDVLVNNAGITRDATLMKMTAEQWQQVLDVNLTGV